MRISEMILASLGVRGSVNPFLFLGGAEGD